MGSGVIISNSQPDLANRYTWLKPTNDGGYELYEQGNGGWSKALTVPAFALKSHSHSLVDFKWEGKEFKLQRIVIESGVITEIKVEE